MRRLLPLLFLAALSLAKTGAQETFYFKLLIQFAFYYFNGVQ